MQATDRGFVMIRFTVSCEQVELPGLGEVIGVKFSAPEFTRQLGGRLQRAALAALSNEAKTALHPDYSLVIKRGGNSQDSLEAWTVARIQQLMTQRFATNPVTWFESSAGKDEIVVKLDYMPGIIEVAHALKADRVKDAFLAADPRYEAKAVKLVMPGVAKLSEGELMQFLQMLLAF